MKTNELLNTSHPDVPTNLSTQPTQISGDFTQRFYNPSSQDIPQASRALHGDNFQQQSYDSQLTLDKIPWTTDVKSWKDPKYDTEQSYYASQHTQGDRSQAASSSQLDNSQNQSFENRLDVVLQKYGRGADNAATKQAKKIREAIGTETYKKSLTYDRLKTAEYNGTSEKDVLRNLDPDIREHLHQSRNEYNKTQYNIKRNE